MHDAPAHQYSAGFHLVSSMIHIVIVILKNLFHFLLMKFGRSCDYASNQRVLQVYHLTLLFTIPTHITVPYISVATAF
jgi:hypothetical protein